MRDGTIKNTVIRYNKTGGWNNGALSGWGVYTKNTLLTNVYIIHEGKSDRVLGNVAAGTAISFKAGTQFIEVAATEDAKAVNYSGLDESIWQVTAGEIPVFKTAVSSEMTD